MEEKMRGKYGAINKKKKKEEKKQNKKKKKRPKAGGGGDIERDISAVIHHMEVRIWSLNPTI